MRRPWLIAAVALLIASNAWVLVHVAANRAGTSDAQLELTSRELAAYGGGREDSSVMLALRWQNTAPMYDVTGFEPLPWFDEHKLAELGFETVLASGTDAGRFYRSQQSRHIYVALELDGPAWQHWLAAREQLWRQDPTGTAPLTPEQRLEVDRETESRLVAIDAAIDPAALRRRHPDREHVMILPALARVMRDEARTATAASPARPARLRGAIIRIAIEQINVPEPLSRQFVGQSSTMSWSIQSGDLKIPPVAFVVTLAVGSKHEPWIAGVRWMR